MGFLPAGCHVSRFTCPAWSLWDSFHRSNLMLHMEFLLAGCQLPYIVRSTIAVYRVAMVRGLLIQREAYGTAFTFPTFQLTLGFLPAGCHVLRFTCPAGRDRFHLSNLMLHMGFLPAVWHSMKPPKLSTGLLCRFEGLLVQREVHGAAFILLTWCSVGFLPAGCHGFSFYLSSGKPMGQLSPMGFLPAGRHGLRFYLSSGKPMGQLSSMWFLPAGCHGLKFYLSSGKPMAQLSPMGFLPAGRHGLKFYLSSGKPMGQLSPMGFLPAGCHVEVLPVQRLACGTAFTYGIFTGGLPWYETL
jgi:hypothetical protein